jgi:hypothetical protein
VASLTIRCPRHMGELWSLDRPNPSPVSGFGASSSTTTSRDRKRKLDTDEIEFSDERGSDFEVQEKYSTGSSSVAGGRNPSSSRSPKSMWKSKFGWSKSSPERYADRSAHGTKEEVGWNLKGKGKATTAESARAENESESDDCSTDEEKFPSDLSHLGLKSKESIKKKFNLSTFMDSKEKGRARENR